jgi:hypothetical protein
MLCGLTRPAIEAGLVGGIDQQARRERANREAANEAGEETEEEGVEEDRPVDIDGDSTEMGTGRRATLVLPGTGDPNLTPRLPTHIVRRGRSPIVAIDELRMAFGPPIGMKIVSER